MFSIDSECNNNQSISDELKPKLKNIDEIILALVLIEQYT